MTLRDVERLFRHWAKYPPVRAFVAALAGFDPAQACAAAEPSKYMTAEDMQRLMARTGGKMPAL